MYFRAKEHNPPHIHVIYNDDAALIDFMTDEILDGHLPAKALSLTLEWVAIHRKALMQIWETQEFIKLEPLE